MKFTRQGYGELRRQDGTLVSRHLVAEEAYERASREPGVYVYVPAPIRIDVEAPPQPGSLKHGPALQERLRPLMLSPA